jgi:hypothetical protein
MKSLTRNGAIALSIIFVIGLSRCGGGSHQTPPLTIITASLPNGTSQVAYGQTIQASGDVGPFTWEVSAGTLPHNLSLNTSAKGSALVSGTPDTAAQGVGFTIKVTDSAGHSATHPYTISILLEPDTLVASPANLAFGTQRVGNTSAPQAETLTNAGNSALVITGITISGSDGADFANTTNCGATLPAGTNCNVAVTFTPERLGPHGGAITVTDNSVGSPHSFSMDGTGIAQGPNASLSATSISLSATTGTTSDPQSVTLSNYGTATLNIAGITATTGFAETDDCPGSLLSGSSCTISVTFTPTMTGTVSGNLTVTDDAPNNPQTVSLSGTGVAGKCTPKAGFCTSSLQCCAGLQCKFIGGNRGSYRCE